MDWVRFPFARSAPDGVHLPHGPVSRRCPHRIEVALGAGAARCWAQIVLRELLANGPVPVTIGRDSAARALPNLAELLDYPTGGARPSR